MKRVTWTLAPLLALAWAGEARSQFFSYYPSGGYAQGGGLGFSYHRRHLSLFGFLGGFSAGGFGMGGPYLAGPYGPGPYFGGYGSTTVYILPPTVMPPQAASGYRRPPTLEEETAGIDLDLVPSRKSSQELVHAPARVPDGVPPDLPGKDVSKPVPPVRPGDLRPPEKAPPPPPNPPKAEPPPPPQPKDESARLSNLGLAAFRAQAYGLAGHRFRQAIAADSKGARAHFLLAQTQFALGKYPEAVASIHNGMRLHKDWPRAPFQPRVDLYAGIEPDFTEHLQRLVGALKEAPKQPTLLFLLAYQLWFDGRRDEAVPLFRQARALTPDPAFIDQFLAAVPPKQVVVK
jgi:hypothetical protein